MLGEGGEAEPSLHFQGFLTIAAAPGSRLRGPGRVGDERLVEPAGLFLPSSPSRSQFPNLGGQPASKLGCLWVLRAWGGPQKERKAGTRADG